MKKYTYNDVVLQTNKLFPPGKVVAPIAFAGKYPTKLAIGISIGQRVVRYFGRPSKFAGALIHHTLRAVTLQGRTDVYVFVLEFDRTGIVRMSQGQFPHTVSRGGTLIVTSADPIREQLYYPWSGRMFPWSALQEKWFSKKLKVNDKVRFVYSPYERLKVAEHILPFKHWVQGQPWA